jgi:hypothetical protein
MDNDDIVKNTDAEPKAEANRGFKILVTFNGVPIGWLTVTGPPVYWLTVTDNEASASVWYQLAYNGKTYIMTGPNNYLSYQTSTTRLNVRGWIYAAAWRLVGTHLECLDNGKLVGVDGNNLYANGENVVDVKFVPV